MNKSEIKEKILHWIDLYPDDCDFTYRWYTHQEQLDIIAHKKKQN